AAPVGGDHLPVAAQRIDHELEGGRGIHPAVEQEDLRRIGRPPPAHGVGQTAHRQLLGGGGLVGGSGGGLGRHAGSDFLRDNHAFILAVDSPPPPSAWPSAA